MGIAVVALGVMSDTSWAGPGCKGSKVLHEGKCVYPDVRSRARPKPTQRRQRRKPARPAKPKPDPTRLDWVEIAGGTYTMGSPDGDWDERPRRVTVGRLQVARSEVTVAQYLACVEAGVCKRTEGGVHCNADVPGRAQHPINCVDLARARQYASFVGGRLPTEAEWEYMARSRGAHQRYPWGEADLGCHRALYRGCRDDGTAPVCQHQGGHSAQGVCDLAGNVWELVEEGLVQNASQVVIRGAGWDDLPKAVRMSNRSWLGGNDYRWDIGFRVVRSVEE